MRTHRQVGFLILLSVLPPAQYPAQAASQHVQYNSRLNISSRQDLDQRLHAPFTEGTAHPAGVTNCAQLLERRGHASQSQASGNELQAERSTMADCLVLDTLWRAKPARISYVSNLPWDEHVLPLLPPQLAITVSTEAKRASAVAATQGGNWPEFDPSITAAPSSKGPDQIVVTGKGFNEQLILWGRGDFNADGIEDLLVQSLDTLTEGTYRNTRLFVLTRKTANGPLTLVRLLL